MKIIVCAKVISGELNPFDESALECALSLSRDVTVISMGPSSAEAVLAPLTRLGAKVILLSDMLYAGSDTLATSYILAKAIETLEYDLVLCGRQSIDGDTAQTGAMLAARLGIPLVSGAVKISEELEVLTREGGVKIDTPALVTLERSYYLRFPSIFSKLGEVTVLGNADIGCEPERCGLRGSPTRVLKTFEAREGKRSCRFISLSELPALIEELRCREPAAVKAEEGGEKLPEVWAVGETVAEKARAIAERVVVIESSEPEYVAERARAEAPNVILWCADREGRRAAAVTAALLETGLCADCTALEADGDSLIMYRPARSGNVIAKIKCLTRPQMATVRCKSESADIIVSGGKGVISSYDRLAVFARELGAELGASRGLVDSGIAPYEAQIGLTGRSVSPKIYIAVGISGAVHHTCAIEGAETVIAINPDKNARIFEYADYGIVSEFL